MANPLQADFLVNFVTDFLTAGVSAAISKTVTKPIDVIQARIQQQDLMIKIGVLDRQYNGFFDCTRRTIAEEGLKPLMRNNLNHILRYYPTQALNFAFNDFFKRLFNRKKEVNGSISWISANFASGGLAGSVSALLNYTLEFPKFKLLNDLNNTTKKGGTQNYSGFLDVYRKTIASEGITGIYRGFGISCLGVFVYRAFYFGLYDSIKPLLPTSVQDNFGVNFAFAWLVVTFSGLASFSIDTTRRIMMSISAEQNGKQFRTFDCMQKIIQAEGVLFLFKGASATILNSIAGAGILSGYDFIKRNINNRPSE